METMRCRWNISRFTSGITSFQDGMFKMGDEARSRRPLLRDSVTMLECDARMNERRLTLREAASIFV